MTIYISLNFRDANDAMQAVWEDEDHAKADRTAFSQSAVGLDTSVWTEDDTRTMTYIKKLIELQSPFSVDYKQQVSSWLDDVFRR